MALSSSPCLPHTTYLSKPFSTSKLTKPNTTFDNPLLGFRPVSLRTNQIRCHAVTDLKSPSSLDQSKGESDDHEVVINPSTEGEKHVAEYNWTEEWYPLYLTKDVPDDAPLGLTVFDQQLVLYKDGNDEFHCYQDRCPNRLAKLSEGQLVDGTRLECLYHGWQFEGNGECVKIPQRAGVGGVLRDSLGNWNVGFEVNCGNCIINRAEIWGILTGLDVDWDKGRRKVELELKFDTPTRRGILDSKLLLRRLECRIKYITMEKNMVAN